VREHNASHHSRPTKMVHFWPRRVKGRAAAERRRAGHRRWVGSTDDGRRPIISGRRQPSCDGTPDESRGPRPDLWAARGEIPRGRLGNSGFMQCSRQRRRSITSSASARSLSGTSNPSALAVEVEVDHEFEFGRPHYWQIGRCDPRLLVIQRRSEQAFEDGGQEFLAGKAEDRPGRLIATPARKASRSCSAVQRVGQPAHE
jgi:hypothetical protein